MSWEEVLKLDGEFKPIGDVVGFTVSVNGEEIKSGELLKEQAESLMGEIETIAKPHKGKLFEDYKIVDNAYHFTENFESMVRDRRNKHYNIDFYAPNQLGEYELLMRPKVENPENFSTLIGQIIQLINRKYPFNFW